MKKLIIIVFAIFVCQHSFSQEVDLGIKAGANFSTITDASEAKNKTGFVAGIFAGLKFSDKVGIQADLLYSQQGAKIDGDKFDLSYVNVPVVAKYYLIKGLNVQLGPQFGFLVDEKVKDVFENIYKAETFDLSGVAGVGLDLPFGIRLAARYHFGITDTYTIAKGKNSVFNLSVGYSFF